MRDCPAPRDVQVVRHFGNGGANNGGTALCIDKHGVYYVRKTIKKDDVANDIFRREVEIAWQVRAHSRVNRIVWHEVAIPRHQLSPVGHIYMEYSDLGPLSDFFERAKRNGLTRLPQYFVMKVMRDIAQALCWLHFGIEWRNVPTENLSREPGWNPVSHNDLHAGNIFLTSTSSDPRFPKAVLGDFGTSSSERHLRRAEAGSSPRDPYARSFSPSADIKSIGIEMAILAGAPCTIQRGRVDFPKTALLRLREEGVSRSYTDIIRQCWHVPQDFTTLAITDLIHRKMNEFVDNRGEPEKLPTFLAPSSRERQPYDQRGWGRNITY